MTIVSVFAVLACTSSGFTGPSQKVGDGRRPSESGEGVGGYLTDPNAVRYERSETKVVVSGDAGSIQSDFGSVKGLVVCLISVNKDLLQQIFINDLPLSGDGVRVIGSDSSAEDGSFKVEGDVKDISSGDLVALDVTGLCAKGQMPLKDATRSIVFMDPQVEGGFSEASPLADEDKNEATNDSVFCEEPAKCKKTIDFKILASDSGEKLTEVTIEAYANDCAGKQMAEGKECSTIDSIYLGKLTSVGLFSDGYQFRVLNPGYKPKDITSLKDFSTSIVLEPTK
jgi:hypothetical protein